MRPQKAGTMDDLIIIENKIYEIRGQRVMLDFDLAEMYEIETKNLNKAVRRNSERFPEDFMFRLTNEEANPLAISLRFQNGTSNKGGNRYAPFAFTEQGVAMLSGVLRSPASHRGQYHACFRPYATIYSFSYSQRRIGST